MAGTRSTGRADEEVLFLDRRWGVAVIESILAGDHRVYSGMAA